MILCLYSQSVYANIVVTGNDFHPFTDEKLPNGGIYTSIVKKILENMNFKYELLFYPWARGYEMVRKGTAVLTFPYIKTKERLSEVLYADDFLIRAERYILTNNKKENAKSKEISDFSGRVFCTAVGYAIDDKIQEMLNKKQLKLKTRFDQVECLNDLLEGDVDFVTMHREYITEHKLTTRGYRMLEKPIYTLDLYVIFGKQTDPDFIKKFNNASRKFKSTEEYKKLINF